MTISLSKTNILWSAGAALLIPGIIFGNILSEYPLIYSLLVVAHFLYTYLLIFFSNIRILRQPFFEFLAITLLVATIEILLNTLNLPLSYTLFLDRYPLFLNLLPWVGSELALGLIMACCVTLWRIAVPLAVLFVMLGGLLPLTVMPLNGSDDIPPLDVAIVQTQLSPDTTSYPGLSGGLQTWQQQLIEALDDINNHDIDMAIFPESALPGYYNGITPFVATVLQHRKNYELLAHQYVDRNDGSISSQARLYGRDHRVLGIHEKSTPLPVAEHLVHSGTPAFFYYANHDYHYIIAPLICSETLHINQTRSRLAQSDFAVALVNDADVMPSYLPELHFVSDKIRAIEMGKALVRASNYRGSGLLDGYEIKVINELNRNWNNQYLKVNVYSGSLFSKTFVFQCILIILVSIILILKLNKHIYISENFCVYSLLMISIIYANLAYGCENPAFKLSENVSPFYIDEAFPARQLGVVGGDNLEPFSNFVDTSHIAISDVPETRGIGVLNTIHGQIYITSRHEDQFVTLSEDGFLTLTLQQLESLSISDVLWYSYKQN